MRNLTNRAEWLDGDGYPTEYAVEMIATWPYTEKIKFDECLDFVRLLWAYPKYVSKHRHGDRTLYRFCTAGWSGNEALIIALESNILLRAMCWVSSERGGKHVYEVKDGGQLPKEEVQHSVPSERRVRRSQRKPGSRDVLPVQKGAGEKGARTQATKRTQRPRRERD